jgi:hypothetical protein
MNEIYKINFSSCRCKNKYLKKIYVILDLLGSDRICASLFLFKIRDINTKMGHSPQPPYPWKTHRKEGLCDISDYHQAGNDETSVAEGLFQNKQSDNVLTPK